MKGSKREILKAKELLRMAVDTEKEPACLNCEHFRQHYIRDPETLRYLWVNAGHCVFSRLKQRKPYDVCENHKAMDKMDVALSKWVDEMM